MLRLSIANTYNFHRTTDRKLGENPPIVFYAEKLKILAEIEFVSNSF